MAWLGLFGAFKAKSISYIDKYISRCQASIWVLEQELECTSAQIEDTDSRLTYFRQLIREKDPGNIQKLDGTVSYTWYEELDDDIEDKWHEEYDRVVDHACSLEINDRKFCNIMATLRNNYNHRSEAYARLVYARKVLVRSRQKINAAYEVLSPVYGLAWATTHRLYHRVNDIIWRGIYSLKWNISSLWIGFTSPTDAGQAALW